MDYEKKYNEALERARKIHNEILDNEILGFPDQIREIFPELRGLEDERIRKFLKDYAIEMIAGLESDISISVYDGVKGHDPDAEEELEKWMEARAWLENQKEQKPVEWSEEDERIRLACIATINDVIDYERDRWEDYNPGKPYRPITKYDEQIDWLKSLRPSWKLREEQPEADLEKASRNVYESWMGGTMDDVRRDMVELGKVLNARKED